MFEIAGDAFFWISFSNFLGGAQLYPLWGGGRLLTTGTHPICDRCAVRKCKITKSQAFETKNYGHPETIIGCINFKRYTQELSTEVMFGNL